MKVHHYYIIVLFLISTSCSTKETSLKTPAQFASLINTHMDEMHGPDKKLKLLVFFNGNCPACFGTISAVSDNFPSTPMLVISNAVDTVSINYNFEKLNTNGILIYDPQDLFYQKNKALLEKYQIFLLNGNKIVEKNEFRFDNKVKKAFKRAIEKEMVRK